MYEVQLKEEIEMCFFRT